MFPAFQPKKITAACLWITAALTIIFIAFQILHFIYGYNHVFGLASLFEFRYEGPVQTLFSSALLLFSSLLFLKIAAARKYKGLRSFRWAVLSLIFFFLSLDEAFEIHEHVHVYLRPMIEPTLGIFYYLWVIPYGILTVIFILYYFKFFVQLPASVRTLFLTGFFLFIAGALGFEILGAYYHQAFNNTDLGYVAISGVEEVMEMVGIILLNHALMVYINNDVPVDAA